MKINSLYLCGIYSSTLVMLLFLLSSFIVSANTAEAAPLYSPGQTLDPTCLPTNPDCTITTSASSTVLFNYDVYSTPTVTYQHPRAPGELTGSNAFVSGSYATVGMYELMASTTSVSAIQANVWNLNNSRNVTLKLFARTATTTFNPETATPLSSTTINYIAMPHASAVGGSIFNLTTPVTVPAGQYLYVLWESVATNEMNIGYFNSNSSSAPYRHSFILGNLNAIFSNSSLPDWSAATFTVYGITDLSRQSSTVLGSNLVLNPGFETTQGTGVSPWSNWSALNATGTVANETSYIHSGINAAKITSGAGDPWYNPQIQSSSFSVIPGQTYQLSFWTRGNGTNAGNYGIYDSTHSAYIGGTESSTMVTGTTYTQVTTTFVVPVGCNSVKLFFYSTAVAGTSVYYDDVSVNQMITNMTFLPINLQTLLNDFPSAAVTFTDPNGVMTSTNVQSAIVEAYNHASTTTQTTSSVMTPRIVMPDTIYAVAGDELQVFVRGVIEAMNPYNLPYAFTSSIGNSYPRYFDVTPTTAQLGTTTLTVSVTDLNQNILASKTVNIVVASSTASPATLKNILTVGDSLSSGGVWQGELARRLQGSGGTPVGYGLNNINFIGDEAMPASTTQAYTGYGGWTWENYIGTTCTTCGHILTGSFDKDKTDVNATYTDGINTWNIEYAAGSVLKIHGSGTLASSGTLTYVSGGTHTSNIVYTAKTDEPESPFWSAASSTLSFHNWATRNRYSGIDGLYVLLGWNQWGESTSTAIAATQTFLNAFHSEYPNAQVGLVGIEVPSVNGGLGNNYGASTNLAQYYWTLQMANNLNMAYQQLANNSSYSGWVKFIGTASQFDSENNMSQALTPVNTRNPATEQRGTNGVHPATYGYYQIADAIFREFVNIFLPH